MKKPKKSIKKDKKVFTAISGTQWLNIVNSFGEDGLTAKKTTYYKFNDGRMAIVLKNNWKTLISEIVDSEDELDKEEARLTQAYNSLVTTDNSHLNNFLDLGKLLKQQI